MASCDICGARRKCRSFVSHSNRHTNRWFLPNIQRATLMHQGKLQRLHVCTRCLRTVQNKRMTA